jgi:hypothetical protein
LQKLLGFLGRPIDEHHEEQNYAHQRVMASRPATKYSIMTGAFNVLFHNPLLDVSVVIVEHPFVRRRNIDHQKQIMKLTLHLINGKSFRDVPVRGSSVVGLDNKTLVKTGQSVLELHV